MLFISSWQHQFFRRFFLSLQMAVNKRFQLLKLKLPRLVLKQVKEVIHQN